jgi:hypothetical protein
MEPSPRPRRGSGRRIALAAAAVVVLVPAGYAGGLLWFAPDESKLTAWRNDLEGALAEAKGSDRLVLVKAGSKH